MTHEDELISPLLGARDRIDAAIQGYLDKVALLRKRREAIQAAIDIVRAGDDEIMQLPVMAAKIKKTRVTMFDTDLVERQVLTLLASGPKSFTWLESQLEGVEYSKAGLHRILRTCPKVTRIGERNIARYSLTEASKSV